VRTALFSRNWADRDRALRFLVKRNKKDVIPALITVLRAMPDSDGRLLDALQRLAGAKIPRDWTAWMEWLEEHAEIRPYRPLQRFHGARGNRTSAEIHSCFVPIATTDSPVSGHARP